MCGVDSFSVLDLNVSEVLCLSERVHLQPGEVLVLLCFLFSWLWPRQTVVVPGPRLMSGFAALQRSIPPCWCGATEHHSGPTLLQSYKSPTVRPGLNGTATAGDGQAHREGGRRRNGGRKRCRGGMKAWAQHCVFTSTYGHLRFPTMFPLKAASLSLFHQCQRNHYSQHPLNLQPLPSCSL